MRGIDERGLHKTNLAALSDTLRRVGGRRAALCLSDGFPVPPTGFDQRPVVGGDATLAAIAAASVIAKVTRDRFMQRMEARYPGWEFADPRRLLDARAPRRDRAARRLAAAPACRSSRWRTSSWRSERAAAGVARPRHAVADARAARRPRGRRARLAGCRRRGPHRGLGPPPRVHPADWLRRGFAGRLRPVRRPARVRRRAAPSLSGAASLRATAPRPPASLADVDLIFFDPADLSPERDAAVEAALRAEAPDLPWQAKNQAAVHLWYPRRFGVAVEPFTCSADAVATFPETATSVALHLDAADRLTVVAPYGVDDLLGLVLRHNPRRVSAEFYEQRLAAKRIRERWPRVTVLPAARP